MEKLDFVKGPVQSRNANYKNTNRQEWSNFCKSGSADSN
jgi:hypothetical protein